MQANISILKPGISKTRESFNPISDSYSANGRGRSSNQTKHTVGNAGPTNSNSCPTYGRSSSSNSRPISGPIFCSADRKRDVNETTHAFDDADPVNVNLYYTDGRCISSNSITYNSAPISGSLSTSGRGRSFNEMRHDVHDPISSSDSDSVSSDNTGSSLGFHDYGSDCECNECVDIREILGESSESDSKEELCARFTSVSVGTQTV